MSNAYRRALKKSPIEDLYQQYNFKLPKSLMNEVLKISDSRNVSIGRLLSIALANELEQEELAFKLNMSLPRTPYIPDEFDAAAEKVLRFVQRKPNGVALEVLVLCKNDFGLSRNEVMGAVRQLFEEGMIKWGQRRDKFTKRPIRTVVFNEDPDYKDDLGPLGDL